MKFLRFTILSPKDSRQIDVPLEEILINADHIISIKPIKIVTEEDIKDGYWIRTSNNKKYRAVKIPQILADALEGSKSSDKDTVRPQKVSIPSAKLLH